MKLRIRPKLPVLEKNDESAAAMITLKLWQLASLALPLIILLLGQVVLMALFAYAIIYNVMGRDCDAAILCAGSCGFGMGATPNAMANMQALTERYAASVKAYLLVPIVGKENEKGKNNYFLY